MGFEAAAAVVGESLLADAAVATVAEVAAADVVGGAIAADVVGGAVAADVVGGAVADAAFFGPGLELANAGIADALVAGEFAGVDAAIASQVAAGVLPEATISLPELVAAQDGTFALTAQEVSQGYKIVSTANNVAQKINSAGRVVAQAKAPTAGLAATLPTYQQFGSTPQIFGQPTAASLSMAQGVTGAQVNAELAAQAAAANAGKITFNNSTLMAIGGAVAVFFLARG